MFRRKGNANDFNAEIEAHIPIETERLREQGLSEDDARVAARRTFGNLTQVQERFYESARGHWGITAGKTFASVFACRVSLQSSPRSWS